MSDGFDEAVTKQDQIGGNCGQIFVGSPRGWAVGDIDDDAASAFRQVVEEMDVRPWIVHGTYLINLATPKEDLGERSVETVQQELDACETLGIPFYTFHPGAHTGAGKETGIENVADRLSDLNIPSDVTLLLEDTAGKGTTVGKRFADLGRMVELSDHGYGSIGVCLDTCHLYAAGYDFTTEEGMGQMVEELDETVGVENVHYLHLNDSKHPLGSEKDEHQHLGEGAIGERGFERVINHPRLREKPMVVETPENGRGFQWNISRAKELRRGEDEG